MRATFSLAAVLAGMLAALAACSKPDATPTPTPPATALPSTTSAPVTAPATASVTASATATASTPAAAADAAPTACGSKGLPDCPMQRWMKDHTSATSEAGDLPALAKALDQIVLMAPPGYTNWVSISKDGAAAARAGDLDAARASCTGCHRQYKKSYKADLRARPLPPLP